MINRYNMTAVMDQYEHKLGIHAPLDSNGCWVLYTEYEALVKKLRQEVRELTEAYDSLKEDYDRVMG